MREELEYAVKWIGIPAGRTTFKVIELTQIDDCLTYHILGSACTNKFISAFYRVDDKMHVYIDQEILLPARLQEYRREKRYRRDHIIDYDQLNHNQLIILMVRLKR